MSRKNKMSKQELIVLTAEIQARWTGSIIERELIPVACICMRNVDIVDAGGKGAIEILAGRQIDEGLLGTILDKLFKGRSLGLVETVHLK